MNTLKWVFIFLVAVALMTSGYFIRKGFEKPCVPTTISHTDTISTTVLDTIDNPVPYLVEHTLPGDTVYLPQKIDTLKILKDYYLKRHYELDFSSDTAGVFIADILVTENKIKTSNATIKAKVRVVNVIETKVVEKVKPLQLWAMLGSSIDFKGQQAQVGIDINQKYLLGVSGFRYNENIGWMINAGIKF